MFLGHAAISAVGFPAAGNGLAGLINHLVPEQILSAIRFRLLLFHLKLLTKRRDSSFQHFPLAPPLSLPPLRILLALQSFGLLSGLLRNTRRSGEHSFRAHIRIQQFNSSTTEKELTKLVRMGHAARLENVESAVSLAV